MAVKNVILTACVLVHGCWQVLMVRYSRPDLVWAKMPLPDGGLASHVDPHLLSQYMVALQVLAGGCLGIVWIYQLLVCVLHAYIYQYHPHISFPHMPCLA